MVRTSLRACLTLICRAVLLAAPTSSHATTIHVPSEQPTIQAGIDAASAGDTVIVASGTYTWTGEGSAGFFALIEMESGVFLRGETGEANGVTIDGEDQGRVIYCLNCDSTTRIEGFTITGGRLTAAGWPGSGAGMKLENSTPTVLRCAFVANTTVNAGGGGVYCLSSSDAVFSLCTFSGNSASYGGGLGCSSSSPEILECTFLGNSADHGGAISCHDSSPPIGFTVFYQNSATAGGGLQCDTSSSPDLMRCTFSDNSAGYLGSGIYCMGSSSPALQRTIIAGAPHGCAVACDATSAAALDCCDVYGNLDGDWIDCIAGQAGSGNNISLDPLLCDPPGGNFGVAPDSPCYETASPCGFTIGALDISCTSGEQAPAERTTWSTIKALYR